MSDFVSKLILSPLAIIYLAIVNIRNFLYDKNLLSSYRAKLPIICIGNATAGGSGKTPLCLFLAKALQEQGFSPAILLRGYGGEICKPHRVTAKDNAQTVGDEAILHFETHNQTLNSLEKDIPVFVAKNRVNGARLIERTTNANIVIMDDGYQHRKLKRDLNLLLLDISNPQTIASWNNNQILPLGRLREPLRSAIKRASALVFTNRTTSNLDSIDKKIAESGILQRAGDLPYFTANYLPQYFIELHSQKKFDLDFFKGQTSIVLTAIAKPEIFCSMLESLGIKIAKKILLSDHAFFTDDHLEEIKVTRSTIGNCPIFTTTKDLTKLSLIKNPPEKIFALEIAANSAYSANSKQDLLSWILTSLQIKKDNNNLQD
jgi:tetraacyldisaccharide 4'-kinase